MTSPRSPLLAFGTESEPVGVARKTRMLNMITLITTIIAAGYCAFYLIFLKLYLVAYYNFIFTIAYLFVFVFTYYHKHKPAKIFFFSVLMLHIFACTNLFMTRDSGFHLYYFLVPTGVLLLFELEEKYSKIVLSLSSALLFLYCENHINENPLIVVSDKVNHLLYQSVFLINMLEVIFVLTLFSKQIERNEWHLTKLASTDVLTGLNNRRYFFEKGEKLLGDDNKAGYHFCLLLLDLDYFKKINDQYGHAVGDICLKEAGSLFATIPIKNKLCARIGGEEFVVVLPSCGPKRAVQLAEELRDRWQNIHIYSEQGKMVKSTMSIGVSCNFTKQETLQNVLEYADIALYQAKEEGRNRVRYFQPEHVNDSDLDS